jgi:alpha-methylacyl-CoA racemase
MPQSAENVNSSAGPLSSLAVLDMTGIGPGPFAAQMLADMGADVIRVERLGDTSSIDVPDRFLPHRNRRSILLDAKTAAGRTILEELIKRVDVMLEGFRPGVMERLGFGPVECQAINPRLVYGRMTGWGQEGPLAAKAGHDINYLAISGALSTFARADGRPVVPTNLVADFGGGGMLLAFGVVCAALEARSSGQGQVVDAAMVDGVAAMLSTLLGLRAVGLWDDRPGSNLLDTGAPFYDCYETADGRYLALGALEQKFYGQLLIGLGLDPSALPEQYDRSRWPTLRRAFEQRIAERSLAEWTEVFAGLDACVSPVLTLAEALVDAQATSRGTYLQREEVWQPAPAPRFSRTPGSLRRDPPRSGEHTWELLRELGFGNGAIRELHEAAAVSSPTTTYGNSETRH